MIDFKKLGEPFAAADIEWRIAERGKKGDGQWAKVLAYVTNRAIMDRLDDVCGPENWRNEFHQIPGAFLCGLSIRVGDEWVTKWDGAQESNIEATKGGISGAMKRAAVQWGIGRYLYNLEEGWANIHDKGSHYAGQDKNKGLPPMKWDPPALPAWAVPSGTPQQAKTTPHQGDTMETKTDGSPAVALRESLLNHHVGDEAAAADHLRRLSSYQKDGKEEFVKWERLDKIPATWAEKLLKKFKDECEEPGW